MRDLDKQHFILRMAALSDMYGNQSFLSPIVQDLYFKSLESLSLEQFNYAIGKHLKNTKDGKFFPKPADILGYIESTEDAPLKTWLLVEKAAARHLWHYNITFNDKYTHFVIESLGGFYRMFHGGETKFLQTEFCRRYRLANRNDCSPDENVIYGRDALRDAAIFSLGEDGFDKINEHEFHQNLKLLQKTENELANIRRREIPQDYGTLWEYGRQQSELENLIGICKSRLEVLRKPLKLVVPSEDYSLCLK